MEFSDDYSSFQIQPLNHRISQDFSTEFAAARVRKRTRSKSSSCSGSATKDNFKVKRELDRRTCLSVSFVVIILIAVLLPSFQTSSQTSEDLLDKYITVVGTPKIVKKEIDTASNAEAVKSVQAALGMKLSNKIDKARKLFEHAVALSPHNAFVLLHYGEFLEHYGQPPHDLLEADHQFTRAVVFSLDNTEERTAALEGRKRTASKVDNIDAEVLKRIDLKKNKFNKIDQNSKIMKRVKHEAYVQYIYHTVGIEGNTMNMAQTRSILETKLAVAGKSIMEHNEILGMDSALKYINNTLVDRIGDITFEDILEIHKRVLGNVDPTDAGILRKVQVFVGDHVPPPPWNLNILLSKFITWLNSKEALGLHPVRLAALAHYKLVHIHPWLDGNGRTSRLLMNLVLMQSGYPPVIIRRADRETYYQHLVTANEGDIRPFIRFIALCTENTLDAYLWASREFDGPELTGDQGVELPFNVIEHSLEQVNTQISQQLSSHWINFAPEKTVKQEE